MYGYVLRNGDKLDFSAALKGTAWDGNQADLSQYVHVAMSGNDAQISISDTAGSAGSLVATLHSSGYQNLTSIAQHSVF